MNFLADENVDSIIVDKLRENNYSVNYVAEFQPSIPDKEILQIANQKNAIIITSDKDFGELVFRQRLINSGVILLRLHGLNPETKAATVINFIDKHSEQMLNSFSVISKEAVRIRKRIN